MNPKFMDTKISYLLYGIVITSLIISIGFFSVDYGGSNNDNYDNVENMVAFAQLYPLNENNDVVGNNVSDKPENVNENKPPISLSLYSSFVNSINEKIRSNAVKQSNNDNDATTATATSTATTTTDTTINTTQNSNNGNIDGGSITLTTDSIRANNSNLISSGDLNQTSLEKDFGFDGSDLYLLDLVIESHLEKSKAILAALSKHPAVKNFSFMNEIDKDNFHGIPPNVDLQKRKIADYILTEFSEEFVSVLFLLPNGDVYLLEPYSRQENLSTSNLSFRDYYQGALSNNSTYLGNVILSASTGLKQAQFAVPLFEDNHKTNRDVNFNVNVNASDQASSAASVVDSTRLTGLLSAGLNLTTLEKLLESVSKDIDDKDKKIVLIDGKGMVVADSIKGDKTSFGSINGSSFANLQSFKNAISGESGTITETINGSKMIVSYAPVDAISQTWALLSIEPYTYNNGIIQAYKSTSNATTNESMEKAEQKQSEQQTPLPQQQQQYLSANTKPFFIDLSTTNEQEILIQNTSMSKPAPVNHTGQPTHQVVFALPLRDDGKIWSGTVTFTASKPIEVEILHDYSPVKIPSLDHGEPYHAILPGNKSIAITHLRDLVDIPLEIGGTGISSGSIDFVGNALIFHKTDGDPFTVTYTIDARLKEIINSGQR